jgi:hypothetical protein
VDIRLDFCRRSHVVDNNALGQLLVRGSQPRGLVAGTGSRKLGLSDKIQTSCKRKKQFIRHCSECGCGGARPKQRSAYCAHHKARARILETSYHIFHADRTLALWRVRARGRWILATDLSGQAM